MRGWLFFSAAAWHVIFPSVAHGRLIVIRGRSSVIPCLEKNRTSQYPMSTSRLAFASAMGSGRVGGSAYPCILKPNSSCCRRICFSSIGYDNMYIQYIFYIIERDEAVFVCAATAHAVCVTRLDRIHLRHSSLFALRSSSMDNPGLSGSLARSCCSRFSDRMYV